MNQLHRRTLSLCSLVALGCPGDRGIVGSNDESEGGETVADTTTSSEPADGSSTEGPPTCDGLCDPDFAIAHLTVANFGAQTIHLLATADGACEGDRCPNEVGAPIYDGNPLVPCLATPEAEASPLGAAEYCRPWPLVATFGISLGFTTSVERSSFEELATNLHDGETEPYLWHSDVVTIEGPGSAFNAVLTTSGSRPRAIESAQNLTCIDRLAALGIAWTAETLADECAATWDDAGTLRPRSMAPMMTFTSFPGRHATGGGSCEDEGCCSHCDYELSVAIAKYGVTDEGARRDPTQGTALTCDPSGDVLTECRAFVAGVDRSLESESFVYAWDGEPQSWPLPLGDKLRETHPDDRPPGLESAGAACENDDECDEGLACTSGTCRVPWPVECVANPATTGATAYCVDARFDDGAAAACHVVDADFEYGDAGDRLSGCDEQGTGLNAAKCCDPALGGDAQCDPLFQPGVAPVPREDRDPALIALAQCVCDDASASDPACADAVQSWCAAPLGSPDPAITPSLAGQWAVRPVSGKGGVRLELETSLVDVRIADLGGEPRAHAEACAESRFLIPRRELADRWNDTFLPERLGDHDLTLCSGSTYRMRFTTGESDSHIRSEAGGTLEGRDVLVFETSQFRVIPDSAFPTDNLDIGACDSLGIRLSNKFDLSPSNLRKLELRSDDGELVAGGSACSDLATPEEVAAGAIPCLAVGVDEHLTGQVDVSIDFERYGQLLVPGQRYHLVVPGLSSIAAMADAQAYAAAFHDACGMPLVLGEGDALALSEASFEIDHGCE